LISSPLAIAAIGSLPLPFLSRCIDIQMHRSPRDDLKTLQDLALPQEIDRFDRVRRHIAAWAQDVKLQTSPQLPKRLHGRTADNWRVLTSVGDAVQRGQKAREAALAFAADSTDEDAPIALLYDMRTIRRTDKSDRIKSAVLASKLHELEEGVGIWGAWRGEDESHSPHPITQYEISILLRRFNRALRPTVFKMHGKPARGYLWSQIEPWIKRYCREDDEPADPDKIRQLNSE
jgi:hypothetical protein